MQARQWIKGAESQGWTLQEVKGLTLALTCSKQGCSNRIIVPLDNLGPVPAPCNADHIGQYAAPVARDYRETVGHLVRRRRSLGLSQDDVGSAAGLADGHINKLEAFARTATFPTLQLWAQTLGLKLTLEPCPLPPATVRAIEQRRANPYADRQARNKHHPQRALIG